MTKPAATPASAGALIGFYVLYFGAVGILVPFLPRYLETIGLTPTEVGVALAAQPVMATLAPSWWGALADRTGRPGRVLTTIGLGAIAGFAPLSIANGFWSVLLCLGAYAFFSTSVTTLLDTIALQRVAVAGGNFARLRLFGSAGFLLSATAFGFAVSAIDRRTVMVPLALIVAYALWSLRLHTAVPANRASADRPQSPWRLLENRDLVRLLIGSCLHWMALAPMHVTLSIHLTALGHPPWVIGVCAGIGVAGEIAVMSVHPVLARRLSPRALLVTAYAVSAVRWAGMTAATSALALVALSALHSMSFGAYYASIIGDVARRVPPARRASGQALFVVFTFGVGGLLGYVGAGVGYDWMGGFRLFGVAALLELLALGLTLTVRPAARAEMETPA